MPLTAKKIESAKPTETLYRIADSNGLCLEVPPSGKKRWRLRYRANGKQKMVSLGTYPNVNLKEARKKRDILRVQIQEDIAPSKARKEKKAKEQSKLQHTFEAIALKWAEKHYQNKSPKARVTDMSRLARDVFPKIGSAQIAEVTLHKTCRSS